MPDYPLDSLGAVVATLRKERGLTQAQLGNRAGYGGGAGVAISRLENGQLLPGPDRLKGVAQALGISVDELTDRASKSAGESEHSTSVGEEPVADRLARIARDIEDQQQLERDLNAFTEARDRANDRFLMRFSEIAARIEDSPRRSELNIDEMLGSDTEDLEAKYQIDLTTAGVAHALATRAGGSPTGRAKEERYKSFVQAVGLGLASTGASILAAQDGSRAIGGYSAAVRAGQVAARSANARRGNAIALGLIAGAAVVGLAELVSMAAGKRKRMQHEMAAKLQRVETANAEVKPNVDALRGLLPKATETLEYIALHAAHALERWEARIGPRSLRWMSLTSSDRLMYEGFVEITAAQLAVAGIDIESLWMAGTDELERETRQVDRILDQSRLVVMSHA